MRTTPSPSWQVIDFPTRAFRASVDLAKGGLGEQPCSQGQSAYTAGMSQRHAVTRIALLLCGIAFAWRVFSSRRNVLV
jgi:hypothetical protein